MPGSPYFFVWGGLFHHLFLVVESFMNLASSVSFMLRMVKA